MTEKHFKNNKEETAKIFNEANRLKEDIPCCYFSFNKRNDEIVFKIYNENFLKSYYINYKSLKLNKSKSLDEDINLEIQPNFNVSNLISQSNFIDLLSEFKKQEYSGILYDETGISLTLGEKSKQNYHPDMMFFIQKANVDVSNYGWVDKKLGDSIYLSNKMLP